MEFVIGLPRHDDTDEYQEQYDNLREWLSMPHIRRDPDVATGATRVSEHIWTAGRWTEAVERYLSNTILRWNKYPHEILGGNG